MYVFTTIFTKLVQPTKGPVLDPPYLPSNIYLNAVTVDGMVMLVKVGIERTNSSSVVTKGGIVKLVKLVPLKHENAIVVIEGGNEMLVRFDQLLNAM